MTINDRVPPDTIRAGCQTITWGEEQRRHFPEVFREAAEAGYEGVEIGFRHLRGTSPEKLSTLLRENGLVLLASHLGGNLDDPAQADAERSVLDEALDYVSALGTDLLLYSGLRCRDDAQFAADLATLSRAAVHCWERGVRLLYHNHDWEFHDGGRIISALLSRTDIPLSSCVRISDGSPGAEPVSRNFWSRRKTALRRSTSKISPDPAPASIRSFSARGSLLSPMPPSGCLITFLPGRGLSRNRTGPTCLPAKPRPVMPRT